RNRRYSYEIAYNILRYSILGITMIVMLAGSIFLITLLDPYSIFGRFMTLFGKPLVVQVNNVIASLLSRLDIYILYKVELKGIHAAVYALPALFLILVGYLSLKRGRLYCNTVCPAGTFLGFISKVSIFRIKINATNCTRCGRCAKACKSSCIDFLNEVVDVSRCVTCFNCIDSCNENAISFSFNHNSPESASDDEIDKSKRSFILNTFMLASFAGVASGQNVPVPTKESTVPEDKTAPVCPPGGVSIGHFNDYCIACSLCVGACPTSVLRPSFRQYGLIGIMQPVMDYHKGFCNFECTVCIDVCPTGALLPLVLDAKKLTQLGKAKFIKKNCIVETEHTDCGACSEHCPTKAVKMVPLEVNLVIPEVEEDICIGCGACEYACPTKPFKAIFVNGNPVHLDAKKPKEEAIKLKELEEFPF
ncbi:MAG: 4Fe-4S dicluster domain-containing protein, partial [Bacteroidia bacterium]